MQNQKVVHFPHFATHLLKHFRHSSEQLNTSGERKWSEEDFIKNEVGKKNKKNGRRTLIHLLNGGNFQMAIIQKFQVSGDILKPGYPHALHANKYKPDSVCNQNIILE